MDLHHPGWQSQGVWVGNIMTPDLPPNPGCQSTQGFILFLVGDPNLNLHLPLAYWIGGVDTKYGHLKLTQVLIQTGANGYLLKSTKLKLFSHLKTMPEFSTWFQLESWS